METRALLQAAKRGDAQALEALCRRYHPRLCRYAYVLTRSREEAEDVAQETLVAMLRALPKFRGADAGKFEGWLLRIARNRVYSEARRFRLASLPENFDPPDPAPPPGERLERAERRARSTGAGRPRRRIAGNDRASLRIGTFLSADCGDAGNNPRARQMAAARCAGKAANPVGRRGAVRQAGREGNGEETACGPRRAAGKEPARRRARGKADGNCAGR